MTAMTDDGTMQTGVHADTPGGNAPWAVYLLDCAGGKSYIGISPRPQERFETHLAGKGGAFTRANRPQGLAALVWFESRSAAASIEPRLKCLRRQSKLAWFEHLAGTTAPAPATLDEGLAGLRACRDGALSPVLLVPTSCSRLAHATPRATRVTRSLPAVD
jgi:putative endonuclease